MSVALSASDAVQCALCHRVARCLTVAISDDAGDTRRSVLTLRTMTASVCRSCVDAEFVKREPGKRHRWSQTSTGVEALAVGVTSTPGVQGGNPCVAGTRWETIIARQYGYDVALILADYPHLDSDQIEDAIAYERSCDARRDSLVRGAP